MEKYDPNPIGQKRIEIIRKYLPESRVYWSAQSGCWMIENLKATTRVFFIDLKPRDINGAELAFFITHLSGGKFNYNAIKKEIFYGLQKSSAQGSQKREAREEF